QDYDETWIYWGGGFNNGQYYIWLLDPYVKMLTSNNNQRFGVWTCPSGKAFRTGTIFNTYGYNYLRLGYLTTSTNAYLAYANTPAAFAALDQPADTVAFMDAIDLVRPPYGTQINGYPREV